MQVPTSRDSWKGGGAGCASKSQPVLRGTPACRRLSERSRRSWRALSKQTAWDLGCIELFYQERLLMYRRAHHACYRAVASAAFRTSCGWRRFFSPLDVGLALRYKQERKASLQFVHNPKQHPEDLGHKLMARVSSDTYFVHFRGLQVSRPCDLKFSMSQALNAPLSHTLSPYPKASWLPLLLLSMSRDGKVRWPRGLKRRGCDMVGLPLDVASSMAWRSRQRRQGISDDSAVASSQLGDVRFASRCGFGDNLRMASTLGQRGCLAQPCELTYGVPLGVVSAC